MANELNQLVIVGVERRVEGRVAYVTVNSLCSWNARRSNDEGKGQRVATACIEQQVSGAREACAGFLLDAASAGVRVFATLKDTVDGVAPCLR